MAQIEVTVKLDDVLERVAGLKNELASESDERLLEALAALEKFSFEIGKHWSQIRIELERRGLVPPEPTDAESEEGPSNVA